MKTTLAISAALFAFTLTASAQQAVFGSGAFSQSESSQGFQGVSASGAGSIGPGIALSSNVQTMVGTQSSAGLAAGGTGVGAGGVPGSFGIIGAGSAAGSGTTTTSNVGIGSTSFSASTGQAGGLAFGGNQSSAFSGSAANAFGGFGVSLN